MIYIYIFNFFVFFVLGIQNFCNEPFLKTKDKKNVRVFPITNYNNNNNNNNSTYETNCDSGVCTVRWARFFLKFVTEPIRISFVIIKTDAYQLGSVFRPITVRFDWLGLIGLVGLKH